jgi:hypothetical protein
MHDLLRHADSNLIRGGSGAGEKHYDHDRCDKMVFHRAPPTNRFSRNVPKPGRLTKGVRQASVAFALAPRYLINFSSSRFDGLFRLS